MTYRILRLPAVVSKTGVGRSTIYAKIAADQFPKPIKLGTRSIGWVEADIDNWLSDKVRASRPESRDQS